MRRMTIPPDTGDIGRIAPHLDTVAFYVGASVNRGADHYRKGYTAPYQVRQQVDWSAPVVGPLRALGLAEALGERG